jgi:pimeloyl-ACP methyl ester carboxylesterase
MSSPAYLHYWTPHRTSTDHTRPEFVTTSSPRFPTTHKETLVPAGIARQSATARRRPPHRRPVAAAALSAALLLGACSTPGSGDDAPTSQGASASADLEQYRSQFLEFGSCEGYGTTALTNELFTAVDRAECAHLTVPIDYDTPGGDTAQIAVTRLPARGEPLGSLIVNPGGPGGPGAVQAIIAAGGLAETDIVDRFDIVGFDPRGVGASTPTIDCLTDEQADTAGMVFPLAASEGSWTSEDTETLARQCIDRTGSETLLAHAGSRDVARDMDILRTVLGDEKLTFMGQSYGTRLGAVYAEMFPDRVRAMVLDGAQDPLPGTAERRLTQYAGFQRAFDLMAESCAQRSDCVLGTEPARAVETFHSIMRPLIDTPIVTDSGRPVTYNIAVGAVIAGLYQQASWPQVFAGIAEAQHGRGEILLGLNDTFAERGADGVWSNYLEANFAINCIDEQRRTPEQEEDLRAAIYATAPFMDPGRGPSGARDGCESWPGETDLTYPYATDIEGLPSTLTISITGDPSTPYQSGVSLAETLGGSLLTVEGEQHTIAMSGTSDCVNAIVTDYLIDLAAPDTDATCTLR